MGRRFLFLSGSFFWGALFLTSSLKGADLQSLERRWGLSSLSERTQHPLEKIEIQNLPSGKGKKMRVTSWYEDRSVTNFEEPSNRLYCRFMHNFLFGRAQLRKEVRTFPIDLAFAADPQIQELEFQYFAVVYRNKPSSPYWDKVPNAPPAGVDPEAQLRVLWTREENVVPYLSVSITREQWRSVSAVLRERPFYSASAFEREACDSMYRLIPRVKANFSELRKVQSP